MTTNWYVLRVNESGEALFKCSDTGYRRVRLRPTEDPGIDEPLDDVYEASVVADHNRYEPEGEQAMASGASPQATDEDEDLYLSGAESEKRFQHLGVALNERMADDAVLYVAIDGSLGALMETVTGRTIEATLDGVHSTAGQLWQVTRALREAEAA